MTIRKSTPEDLVAIMSIYEIARQSMRQNGNSTQWVNGYPQRTLILDDISKGVHYCVCSDDGTPVAVFAFIVGDDPTYAEVQGQWMNNQPYGTIHRIGSNGQQKGILSEVVRWAFHHISNIRIDTHADNAPMLHLLSQQGFTYCGVIHVADGTPRNAFQKVRPLQ
mgnify:CR=1 FL=1